MFKRYMTQRTVKRYGGEETLIEPNVPLIIRDGLAAFVLLVLFVVFQPFSTVPTGHRGVVTQFGRIIGIENEGLAVLPPWQRLHIFNVRAEQADVDKAEGATADLQPVNVSMTVRYSISPERIAEVFEKYSRDGNLDSYVSTATMEAVKSVTAKYTAPDLISKRALVSNDIAAQLRAKLEQYGALVINIDMRNFAFSPSYMAAINDKATQQQAALAAENKLKTVEAEQRQKVAIAEAEAAAKRAQADGEAYAQLKVANARSEAMRIQNAALRESKDALEIQRIEVDRIKAEKWNGQLPSSIYAGAPIPFMGVPGAK